MHRFVPLVCFAVFAVCSGTQPWCDPCGGSNVVTGTGSQGGSGSTGATHLHNISRSAEEAMNSARILMNLYKSTSNPRISEVAEAAIHGFHIDELPHTRTIITEISESLQRDNDAVSRMVVFMDNSHKEERGSYYVIKYHHQMDDFLGYLYNTLCQIKIAAESRNQTLVCDPDLEVPRQLKNLKGAYRNQRDFIIFRDALNWLKSLAEAF